jgi:hypothetical protein
MHIDIFKAIYFILFIHWKKKKKKKKKGIHFFFPIFLGWKAIHPHLKINT